MRLSYYSSDPDDYQQPMIAPLVFDSDNIASMLCVPVPIEDDSLCEGNETFHVNLTDNDPNVVLSSELDSGIVTIIDDDSTYISSVQE